MTIYLVYNSVTGVGIEAYSYVPSTQPYVAITEEFYQSCYSTPRYITVTDGVAALNFDGAKYKKQQDMNTLFNSINKVKITTDGKYMQYSHITGLSLYKNSWEEYTENYPLIYVDENLNFQGYTYFTSKQDAINTVNKLSKVYVDTEIAKKQIRDAVNNATTIEELDAIVFTSIMPVLDITE